MNKKAQEMSMSIVIIAALAVIVLLLVGSFMTGGFRALTGKITGFASAGPSAETSAAKASCDSACSDWSRSGCTNTEFNKVKSGCADSKLTAWSTAYTDSRDGNEYTSTCSSVVGGVAASTCTTGPSASPPALTKAGDYIKYNIEGAGGACACTAEYGQTSGWGN